jgi:hypothetical protein
MTGRVKFATSTAPLPPLADLVSNPTPSGQISRERASHVWEQLGREPHGHQNGRTESNRFIA